MFGLDTSEATILLTVTLDGFLIVSDKRKAIDELYRTLA